MVESVVIMLVSADSWFMERWSRGPNERVAVVTREGGDGELADR